jgi:hypothetical protein
VRRLVETALNREVVVWRGRSLVWPSGVLVANLAFAVWLFWSTWQHPASSWIGDDRDPHILIWALGWTPHNLATLPRHPLITDYIMYPAGANLMWNVSLIFPALVLWPVTALFGPIVTYNVLSTAALALSSWAAYLVVRRYAASEFIAFIAGMLYGFSPYMILQSVGHTQMTIGIFPPLVWLLLDELLVRRRWSAPLIGVLLGVAGTAQLLTSTEILSTTALVAGIGVVLLALLNRTQVRPVLPRAAVGSAVALVTFLVLGAYPLKNLLFGPQRVFGILNVPNIYVADLLSFIVPPGYRIFSALRTWPITTHFTGLGIETGGVYLGPTGLAVMIAALVVGWRWSVVRFAGLLTLAVMVLSMGAVLHINGWVTGLSLPWRLLRRIPLMASALPARLALFQWLGLAVLLGVVGSRFVAAGRRGALGVVSAAVVLIVPLFPTPPMMSTSSTAPAFFASGGEVNRIPPGSVALIVPFSNQESSTAMYWQALSNYRFRMPEGEAYVPGPSLSPPPSQVQTDLVELEAGSYRPRPLSVEREQARINLRQWNIDTIVVGPTPHQRAIVAYFTRVTGRRPEHTEGVYVWWDVKADTNQ